MNMSIVTVCDAHIAQHSNWVKQKNNLRLKRERFIMHFACACTRRNVMNN